MDQPGIGGLDIKEAEYLSNFGPGMSIRPIARINNNSAFYIRVHEK